VADLTDEILMAYADGELDGAMRAEVEAALAGDPELRERLNIFLATGAPLAKLFDARLNEPVPAHLVHLIRSHKSSCGAPGNRMGIAEVFETVLASLWGGPRWTTMMAWSIPILLVAIGLVWSWRDRGGDASELVALRKGQIFAQGPLARALETAPSGTKVSLDGEGSAFTVETVLTFKNRRQAFCRQYDVTAANGDYAGIACRGDDGKWRIEIHIAVSPQPRSNDSIVPAGKGASVVETAVNKVIDGDALGPEDEQALIRNNWQR
jgi:hypothetical protein